MAAKASPTSAATPGQGAYSDPATVAATLGQRWIDVHTPAPSTAATSGAGGLTLQGPTGTTPMTNTNPNAPDLSGLGQFVSPVKSQPKQPPAPKVSIAPAAGMSQLTQGNQLAQQSNNGGSWIGSDIANMFKAPNLNIAAKPPGY